MTGQMEAPAFRGVGFGAAHPFGYAEGRLRRKDKHAARVVLPGFTAGGRDPSRCNPSAFTLVDGESCVF